MKTIQEPRKDKVYTVKCTNRKCQAVMEAYEKEGVETFDQREGIGLITFECPHCKTKICLDA